MRHLIRRAITPGLIAFLLAATGITAGADHYPRQPGIDVLHYAFRIDLHDASDTITGEADIDLRFRQPGISEVAFDLVGPAEDGARGMTVAAVTSDGQPLAFTHEQHRLRVVLPEAPRVETVPLIGRIHTFTFAVDQEPEDVVLDPNTWLLMRAGEFQKRPAGLRR